jgi:hypothetical protein
MKPVITESGTEPGPWQRLGWFIAIWAGSVLALAIVAYIIRAVIAP